MDSVEGCCGLRKTDGFQNAQAGSSPKKVDLIIWEIEVPKVKASTLQAGSSLGLGSSGFGGRPRGRPGSQKKVLSEPEPEGKGLLTLCQGSESFLQNGILPATFRNCLFLSSSDSGRLTYLVAFLGCAGLRSVWVCWQGPDRGPVSPSLCPAPALWCKVYFIIEHSIYPYFRELEEYRNA